MAWWGIIRHIGHTAHQMAGRSKALQSLSCCMPKGMLQLHRGGAYSGATPRLASAVAVAAAAFKHCLGAAVAVAALSLPCGRLSHEHTLLRSLISSPLSSSSVAPPSLCSWAASIYCTSAFAGTRSRSVAPIASTKYLLHLPLCLKHASVQKLNTASALHLPKSCFRRLRITVALSASCRGHGSNSWRASGSNAALLGTCTPFAGSTSHGCMAGCFTKVLHFFAAPISMLPLWHPPNIAVAYLCGFAPLSVGTALIWLLQPRCQAFVVVFVLCRWPSPLLAWCMALILRSNWSFGLAFVL